MIEQLEADLRAALVARAAEVPSAASARLRRTDYRPRVHRVPTPVAFGALAGTVGAAAAVISLVGLGAGASAAFAGWSPSPTQASSAQRANAEATCRARLATTPMRFHASGLQSVLSDTRGPFTVVIFAGGDASNSCISGPSFTALSGSRASGSATVPTGRIALASSRFTSRDGHPYTVVEGHAGAGVTRATLVLDDGTHVTASTANGWFAAWWPGSHNARTAELATGNGVTRQLLDTGGAVNCGPGPCTRAGGSGPSPNAGATLGSVTGSIRSTGRSSRSLSISSSAGGN